MSDITEFQLVLQLPGLSQSDFEDLIGLEMELRTAVGDLGLVDGHDMGVGEMNIFILTSKPIQVFERAKVIAPKNRPEVEQTLSGRGVTRWS